MISKYLKTGEGWPKTVAWFGLGLGLSRKLRLTVVDKHWQSGSGLLLPREGLYTMVHTASCLLTYSFLSSAFHQIAWIAQSNVKNLKKTTM